MLTIASKARPIDLEGKISMLVDWIVQMGFKLAGAILVITIGFKIIKLFVKVLKRSLLNSKMEPSVATFLISIIQISLKIMLFITGASMIGIEMTSFIAVLGTASLAIGLSLQGSLSNFAGGILILLLKPFQVGDYIIEHQQKNEGTVIAIEIFYTKLRTGDNRIVIVPNGILSNTSLTNVTKEDYRRLDVAVDVAYDADIALVKKVLRQIVCKYEHVTQEEGKESIITISQLGSHSIQWTVKTWVEMDHYWDILHVIYEDIKLEFDKYDIEIPYEQLEVRLKNNQCESISEDSERKRLME